MDGWIYVCKCVLGRKQILIGGLHEHVYFIKQEQERLGAAEPLSHYRLRAIRGRRDGYLPMRKRNKSIGSFCLDTLFGSISLWRFGDESCRK